MNGDVIRALGYDPHDVLHVDGGDGTVLASGDAFISDPTCGGGWPDVPSSSTWRGTPWRTRASASVCPCAWSSTSPTAADESALDWPSVVDASARVLGEWVAEHADGEDGLGTRQ